MERLTAAAFGQRRKMLRGALKSLGDAEGLLAAAGIDGPAAGGDAYGRRIRSHGAGAAGPLRLEAGTRRARISEAIIIVTSS